MPITPPAPRVIFDLLPNTTLWSRYYFHAHFTHGKMYMAYGRINSLLKITQLMNRKTRSLASSEIWTQQPVLLTTILLCCWPPSPPLSSSDNAIAKFNSYFQPSIFRCLCQYTLSHIFPCDRTYLSSKLTCWHTSQSFTPFNIDQTPLAGLVELFIQYPLLSIVL